MASEQVAAIARTNSRNDGMKVYSVDTLIHVLDQSKAFSREL